MAGQMKSKEWQRRGFFQRFAISKDKDGFFVVNTKTGEVVSRHNTWREAALAKKALNDGDKS